MSNCATEGVIWTLVVPPNSWSTVTAWLNTTTLVMPGLSCAKCKPQECPALTRAGSWLGLAFRRSPSFGLGVC